MFEKLYKKPWYLTDMVSQTRLQDSSLKKVQLKQSILFWIIDHWNEINFINLDSAPPRTRNAGNRECTRYLIWAFLWYTKNSTFQSYLAADKKRRWRKYLNTIQNTNGHELIKSNKQMILLKFSGIKLIF